MNANRKYKDSVFTLLFSEKDTLIELYNAVNGTSYTPETKVEIETLENALYLGLINDIALKIDDKFIVMTEHQSLSDFLDNDCYPERIGHREKEYNADRMAV